MLSVISAILFIGVLALHTVIAAVMTRFFRIRLETTWGWIFFTVFFIPVVLLISTLLFTGVFQIGVDLGAPSVAAGVLIGLPLAVGFTIDVLYIPPPDEIELPEKA
ncbi:hypothetical protein [Natronocalculus amylovorans]|uniref:DUF7991 domain-containing protein n=1 Tax=Natronocalculus amylovorans TaxID=2917812 RepID=A0AAE3FX07_9EURY|nr:hypothetical protein [Natronocalculus amylovorans]MCL9816470.1 hypothetical protein [Natronocalculus amylovorans]NUE00916.1 hypothetical protein [Halorubraceae archaeon YAN]